MKQPVLTILLVLVILGVLGWPALSMRVGTSGEKSLARTSEARQGFELLKEEFPFTKNQSIIIVAKTTDGSDVLTESNLKKLEELQNWLKTQPNVVTVESIVELPKQEGKPSIPSAQLFQLYTSGLYKQNPILEKYVIEHVNGSQVYLTVSSSAELSTDPSTDFIKNIRQQLPEQQSSFTYMVGGAQAAYLDFDSSLYGSFPRVIAMILVATFILLLIMFRSILIPLKAVITNILSIAATYGILVFVFQWGYLSNLLNFDPVGYVSNLVPVLLFAALFGLSMDYEVFLLSRIREEWLRTGKNQLAVALGLEHTGSVITNAALLFIVVTVAFIFTSQTLTKEMGVGMTMAIIVDATIVRSLLVPATMRLLGRWNWWLPGVKLPPKENDPLK